MELESLVGREIVGIKQEVIDSPEIINKDPYGKNWFGIIKPANLEKELKTCLKMKNFSNLYQKG